MNIDDVGKVFGEFTPPTQSDFDEVVVHVKPSYVLDFVTESLYDAVDSRSIRPVADQVSLEDLKQAFKMLIHIRILYVRGVLRARECDVKQISYPVVLFPILAAIGDVNRLEDRLVLKVEAGEDYPARQEWDRLFSVLNKFVTIGIQVGMEHVVGFPKPKDGDYDVLRMMWVDDLVKGSDKCEAWKGSVAAFLVLSHTDWIWGRPRHIYTSGSYIRARMTFISESFFRRIETR